MLPNILIVQEEQEIPQNRIKVTGSDAIRLTAKCQRSPISPLRGLFTQCNHNICVEILSLSLSLSLTHTHTHTLFLPSGKRD